MRRRTYPPAIRPQVSWASTRPDFAAAAHEIGLPQDLAQECLDAVASQRPLPELPEYEGYEGDGERVLRKEWGDSFEERIALARWTVKVLGVNEALVDSNQVNNPAVARFMARLGAKLAAHSIVVTADRRSSYRNPTDDAHESAVQRVHRLLKLAGS